MVHLSANHCDRPRSGRAGTVARVQTTILALIVLLAGVVTGAVWLYRAANQPPAASAAPATPQPSGLSDSTLAVLQRLNGVLEIRFYSILDPATVPESLTAFAGRVGQLLSAYAQAAGAKIKLTRFDSQPKLNANAAAADGIQMFNLERGEACYLGVALALSGRKETLPRLFPEWEPALEADLTRAIARLVDAGQPVRVTAPVAVSQINTTAVNEVRALIPNLAAVSLEEGTRILRDAALKDFRAAAKEMGAQVKEAEQRLTQAQNGGSEADQQAAIKHLQQVQAQQTEKLKQIAARSKAQIDTFQQLKAAR